MRPHLKLVIGLGFFLFSFFIKAQNLDSLQRDLNNARHDSIRLKLLNILAEICELEDIRRYTDTSVAIAEKNLKENSKGTYLYNFYTHYLAAAVNNIGFLAQQQGETSKAMDYYNKALAHYREINDKEGIALCLNNMAIIYSDQGDKTKALNYWHSSLSMQEEIKDYEGASRSLNNIASVHIAQGDTASAIEYLNKALKIYNVINFQPGMAYVFNNLGTIYNQKGDFDKALEYHTRSLKIKEEIKDNRGIQNSHINIGLVHANKNNIPLALQHLETALTIAENIGDKMGAAVSLKDIADIHLKQKQYPSAIVYAEKSLKIARGLGYPESIKDAAGILIPSYKNTNQPVKAMEMLQLYYKMRDSISNRETRKAAIKTQLKYEYDKKEAEIKAVAKVEKEKIELKATEDKKRQSIIIYSVIAGLLVVSLFSVFLYRGLRKNKAANKIISAQKEIVEEQKRIVDEKQKEMLDSIYYARRIQRSLITPEIYIEKNLNRLKK